MSPFTECESSVDKEEGYENRLGGTMVRETATHLDIVDLLRQVAETHDLPSVQRIKLKIMTKDLPLHSINTYLPNLKVLDLESSNINSLRELGVEMSHLQVLRVGKCRLESLDGISAFKNLTEFSAPNNHVTSIGLISQLEDLTVLDLSRNHIGHWNQLSFLKPCTKLEEIYFHGNPGSKLPNYKTEVQSLLPQLLVLDRIIIGNGVTTSGNSNNGEESRSAPLKTNKINRKLNLSQDLCGNVTVAMLRSKKRQKVPKGMSGEGEISSKKDKMTEPERILWAAEKWREDFKNHLQNKSHDRSAGRLEAVVPAPAATPYN